MACRDPALRLAVSDAMLAVEATAEMALVFASMELVLESTAFPLTAICERTLRMSPERSTQNDSTVVGEKGVHVVSAYMHDKKYAFRTTPKAKPCQ